MTEQELRTLVREVVARHVQNPPQTPARVDVVRAHMSHAQFVMLRSSRSSSVSRLPVHKFSTALRRISISRSACFRRWSVRTMPT